MWPSTDQPTNQPTDGRTDKAGCRVACTRLKTGNGGDRKCWKYRLKAHWFLAVFPILQSAGEVTYVLVIERKLGKREEWQSRLESAMNYCGHQCLLIACKRFCFVFYNVNFCDWWIQSSQDSSLRRSRAYFFETTSVVQLFPYNLVKKYTDT